MKNTLIAINIAFESPSTLNEILEIPTFEDMCYDLGELYPEYVQVGHTNFHECELSNQNSLLMYCVSAVVDSELMAELHMKNFRDKLVESASKVIKEFLESNSIIFKETSYLK